MSTVFNISKGKIQWYWEQARNTAGTGIVVVLLKATGLEADATLSDHDNLSTLLASTNDEADFTLYVRKVISGTSGTGVPAATIDDSGGRVLLDLPDQTWTDAGGAANNTLGAVLICYDPVTGSGADTEIVPLVKHDISATTDGNDLIVRFHADGSVRVL